MVISLAMAVISLLLYMVVYRLLVPCLLKAPLEASLPIGSLEIPREWKG